MAEIVGQLIGGKYRLHSVLGEGAMGVVYRAAQLDAEGQPLRDVALKMIQAAFSRDADFAQRFLREVRITARLRNPHAITVYDTGQTDGGQLYYAMEVVEGPTLREVLQRSGPLPVGRVVRIVGQMCEALAEAHGLPEPIVHRDLKPANIFVETRQGQDWVKVGDFGIAKVMGGHTSGLTQAGAAPGTPRYMAPEQWMGTAVDGRADLYALGIMLYELLTGKAPFAEQEGPMALMYQHLHAAPSPLPESIPVGLRLQVERLLAKNPQDRPANALLVRQALAAAIDGEETRSTSILGQDREAVQANTEAGQGGEPPLHEAEPETLMPRTLLQPATVVQPQAVATRSRPRGAAVWRYGVATGSLLLLGVVLGGLWALFHQPREEARQQPGVTQETPATPPQPQREETQQPKPPPSKSPEESQRKAEERKPAEETRQELASSTPAATVSAPSGMVPVPAGEFWMGCNEQVDKECGSGEEPGRSVFLDAFAIDTYEVTVANYRQCVEAGKCTAPDTGKYCNWNTSGRAQHPVNCVDWSQANAYCRWAGKRLPTEAEWEKAARGTDRRVYPWGNEWDAKKANTGSSGTVAVGSYAAGISPYGVHDMSGNVWEWTADWYHYENSPEKNPKGPESGQSRFVRGGSWKSLTVRARASLRGASDPGTRYDVIGVRCAQ